MDTSEIIGVTILAIFTILSIIYIILDYLADKQIREKRKARRLELKMSKL